MVTQPLIPLEFLQPGEWAEVAEIDGEPAWVQRLAELGIRCACRLRVLQGGSPCLFQIGELRVSLRNELAAHILVRPLGNSECAV